MKSMKRLKASLKAIAQNWNAEEVAFVAAYGGKPPRVGNEWGDVTLNQKVELIRHYHRGYAHAKSAVRTASFNADQLALADTWYDFGRTSKDHCAAGCVSIRERGWTAGVEHAVREVRANADQLALAELPDLLSEQVKNCILAGRRNWRAALGGGQWLALELVKLGISVQVIESLPTEFVKWEVGGTYRHRAFVRCDGCAADAAWNGQPREGMSSQGGENHRHLFGCTAKSRAGLTFRKDGVETYADQ